MSSPSLKEQLEALSLKSVVGDKKREETHRNSLDANRPVQQKPAWLQQAQYGIELLKAHYSNCFKDNKEIKPLKIGIKQDLVKHLGNREDIVMTDKACMVSSLTYYVNTLAYYKSVTEGALRIDLEGNVAGIVTLEEARYSLERSRSKIQKKKNSPSTEKIIS